jgi:hypothetical protein
MACKSATFRSRGAETENRGVGGSSPPLAITRCTLGRRPLAPLYTCFTTSRTPTTSGSRSESHL